MTNEGRNNKPTNKYRPILGWKPFKLGKQRTSINCRQKAIALAKPNKATIKPQIQEIKRQEARRTTIGNAHTLALQFLLFLEANNKKENEQTALNPKETIKYHLQEINRNKSRRTCAQNAHTSTLRFPQEK